MGATEGQGRDSAEPPPPLPQHRHVLLPRGLPVHPVTKGGAKQIPGRQGARCRRHSPARPPRPALRELRALREQGPDAGWVGAPDLEGRFPVWGVETPRPTKPTCSGGPLPLSQKRRCTHPAATPPRVSEQMLELRAARASGTRRRGWGRRGPCTPGEILSAPPSQL